MTAYWKQPLSIKEQLQSLKRRGLIVECEDNALAHLERIGYFRLANYWRPMEADKVNHLFKPNSRLENALNIYFFDIELRTLIFSAIQSVEIAFRTRFMHEVAMRYGSFWIMNSAIFSSPTLAEAHLASVRVEVKRSREDYIREYYEKYTYPDLPPIWKTMEVITFGTVSKLFQNFSDTAIKKKIARSFGLPQHKIMESWIKSIAGLRNFIAHHSRVWNRNYPQMPKLPTKLVSPWVSVQNIIPSKLYAQLCCLAYLLNSVYPKNDFKSKIKSLLNNFPNIDIKAMGFPDDWVYQPLWHS